MGIFKIAILILAALATATLSGMLGMAGGILLLAIMFSVMKDHDDVIPLHGAVQLVSNGTRTFAFLPFVDYRTVGRFALGTLPGMCVGVYLLLTIGRMPSAQPYLKILIGTYILMATFLPKPKSAGGKMVWYDFPLLGFMAGAAALIVGATGPLIAPLFARRDFVKERLVATKAMCQMITHFEKLIVFAFLGSIEVAKFGPLLIGMSAAAIIGTFIGRKLIIHVSPELFVKLFRAALVLAGLKVLVWDGLKPLVIG